MKLRDVLFTAPADRQLQDILADSEADFGEVQRSRYELLIEQAIADLLDDPRRPGSLEVAGRIHYHLKHSKQRTPKGMRVLRPRHLIIARVIERDLVILAFAHERMETELRQRIRRGEEDLSEG